MKHSKTIALLTCAFFAELCLGQSISEKETQVFNLLKTSAYTSGTEVLHYEHKKSGANLVWLKNDDTNRGCTLAFQTRAYDDQGLPHIFEHACLDGSKKYPSSTLFFQMSMQTYQTYMNALTEQLVTYYPLSSLSEDQLFASLDVYMEGVFNPIILEQEFEIKREAVRFVLESPECQIKPTGAVYNEMLGILAEKRNFNYFESKRALFPGSFDSFNYGGKPEEVLNVSWQSVKDFHAKYYKPSNMVIYLYGKLDIDRFLTYFDAFFSNYDRSETDLSDKNYQPFSGIKEVTAEFPVSKDYQTENSSIFNYVFTLPGANQNDFNDLYIASVYLMQESSELKTALKAKFPGSTFYCGYEPFLRHPYYYFMVENINEEDRAEIKAIIDQAMQSLCKKKLDGTYIKVLANYMKVQSIQEEENSDFEKRMSGIVKNWAASDDPLYFIEYRNKMMNIGKTSTPKTIQASAKKYFANPEQGIVLITKPVAGLAEKKAAQEEKYFADMKAGMSKKEIESLIEENRLYNQWMAENEKVSLIDKVKVVGAAEIPEETAEAEISDQNIDGFRLLSGENPGAEYVKASVLFKLNTLPQEYLHPVMLYFDLLGNLPTQKHSLNMLELKMMLSVYSAESETKFYPLSGQYESGGTDIYSGANIVCLNENLSSSLKIGLEMLKETKLDDFDTIRSIAGRLYKSKRQEAIQEVLEKPAENLSSEMAHVASNPSYSASLYAETFDYWRFLEKVSSMDDSEIKNLTDSIKTGLKYVFNRQNLTLVCIGDKKQINQFAEAGKAFAKTLGQEELPLQNVVGTHEALPKNVAVVIPGNANFCYKSLALSPFSDKLNEKYCVFSLMLGDKYFIPQLRFKNGAYMAYCELEERGIYHWTYRDPGIKSTYQIYSKAPDYMKEVYSTLTQEELDGYITMICSVIQKPVSNSERLSKKIKAYLSNDYEQNQALRKLKQVKSVKTEDAKEFIRLLEMLEKDGARITFGNSEQINENQEMYDLIITDLIN
ncbi:insulinase family protein [Treponema sp. C6A8]|uniref:insulinase family protein n=1 Tax=Treponema sp. C6A8 TaxID=1410609 RepID=UPI000486A5B2|nr:insulinase family protein [Treponema sp. C6A8]